MKKKKVLIAGTSKDMCWVLSQIINSVGSATYTVWSEQKLSAHDMEGSFDFLLVDYKWRQNLDTPSLEIISKYLQNNQAVLISSHPVQELQRSIGGPWNPNHILEKPFDINLFISMINEALGAEA